MFKKIVGVCLLIMVGAMQLATAGYLDKNDIKQLIVQEAEEVGVSPALALAVAKVGSNFNHHVRGFHGERGVMQLHGEKGDEYTPEDNIEKGVAKLARLMRIHEMDTVIALEDYKEGWATGMTPDQVDQFVDKVLVWEKRYQEQRFVWDYRNTTAKNRMPSLSQFDVSSLKYNWIDQW